MTGFLCLLGFKVCCGFVGVVGEMISEAEIYTTTTPFLLWWAVVMMMMVVVDKK